MLEWLPYTGSPKKSIWDRRLTAFGVEQKRSFGRKSDFM